MFNFKWLQPKVVIKEVEVIRIVNVPEPYEVIKTVEVVKEVPVEKIVVKEVEVVKEVKVVEYVDRVVGGEWDIGRADPEEYAYVKRICGLGKQDDVRESIHKIADTLKRLRGEKTN